MLKVSPPRACFKPPGNQKLAHPFNPPVLEGGLLFLAHPFNPPGNESLAQQIRKEGFKGIKRRC